MPRCARSTTSLIWGIPVHPTHLLRAIKTHERLLPALRALRGCHLFAPDPPRGISPTFSSSFTIDTPTTPPTTTTLDQFAQEINHVPVSSFAPVLSAEYPLLVDGSLSSGSLTSPITPVPLLNMTVSTRKGISSIPVEILDLIETELRLSAHEEDVPRTLVDAINETGLQQGQKPSFPGWRRICVCGERYEETLDVMRCRGKVMAEVGGKETQEFLLKYFGLTTAVISTPLKHAIILLVLPPKVSTFLAPLNTVPSLPMHPPILNQTLNSYPRNTTGLMGGRLPLSKTYLRRFPTLPPAPTPLITPSEDFIDHLHPGMFAQNHWRLRNQNSGMRASLVDPTYLVLTEEMIRRIRRCVEELVLWKAVRVAREELGYEELVCIEHFNMVQQVKVGKSNDLEVEGIEEDGHETLPSLQQLGNRGRGKRVKFEKNTEEETAVDGEKEYWYVAIKPVMWLLEELNYEP